VLFKKLGGALSQALFQTDDVIRGQGNVSLFATGIKAGYPLVATELEFGAQEETHYFLVQEEHCKGHDEERELTIQEYLKEQGTAYHDEMNKEWLQIMLKKRSAGPTVGALPESTLQMFFMCSYDMDRFRRFVLSDAFCTTYALEDSVYAALEKDDIPLMQFGVKFMKQAFFAERTIPENSDAWEKRVEQRQEVWDARREAVVASQQQAEDQKYKDQDSG